MPKSRIVPTSPKLVILATIAALALAVVEVNPAIATTTLLLSSQMERARAQLIVKKRGLDFSFEGDGWLAREEDRPENIACMAISIEESGQTKISLGDRQDSWRQIEGRLVDWRESLLRVELTRWDNSEAVGVIEIERQGNKLAVSLWGQTPQGSLAGEFSAERQILQDRHKMFARLS